MPATRITLPVSLVLAVCLLALAACDGGSGGGSSKSSSPQDWETRFAKDPDAIDALAAKGDAAVPILRDLLKSTNPVVISNAAMTIKKVGPAGQELIPDMIAVLARFPREPYISDTLSRYKSGVLPYVVTALKSPDEKTQKQAAILINGRKFPEDAGLAVDPLIAIVEGSASDETKREAMGALASIGIVGDAKARPVLERVQAGGGPLGEWAVVCIKRLDSAQVMERIRKEDEAAGK
jgi:hypothetical protein